MKKILLIASIALSTCIISCGNQNNTPSLKNSSSDNTSNEIHTSTSSASTPDSAAGGQRGSSVYRGDTTKMSN